MPLITPLHSGVRAISYSVMLDHMTVPAQNFPVLRSIISPIPILMMYYQGSRFLIPSAFAAFAVILNVFCVLFSSRQFGHAKSSTFHGAKISCKNMARRFFNRLSAMVTRNLNASDMGHGLVVARSRTIFCLICSRNYVCKLITTYKAIGCHLSTFMKPFASLRAEFLCPPFHASTSTMKTGVRF